MRHLMPALFAMLLASCASDPPPRAIIPKPTVVSNLDITPVKSASKATRKAVREIADTGSQTRETAAKLREAIDRAEQLAESEKELAEAFASIQQLAEELSTSLKLAEEKEKTAIEVIDAQEAEINKLAEANAKQKAEIAENEKTTAMLLQQATDGIESRDQLIISNEKLETAQGWLWRAVFVIAGMIAWILRGPIAFGARKMIGLPW